MRVVVIFIPSGPEFKHPLSVGTVLLSCESSLAHNPSEAAVGDTGCHMSSDLPSIPRPAEGEAGPPGSLHVREKRTWSNGP